MPGNKDFNKRWMDNLYSSRDSAKAYWYKKIDNDWSFFKGKITEDDFQNIELVPEFVYIIDYNSFSNLNSNSILTDIIQLDTTKCAFFVAKNNKIIANTYSGFKNGTLCKSIGDTNVDPQYASTIESLLLEKKQKAFRVQIYIYPDSGYYIDWYAFYDGKDIVSINQTSFKNNILDFKSRMEKAKKTGEIM